MWTRDFLTTRYINIVPIRSIASGSQWGTTVHFLKQNSPHLRRMRENRYEAAIKIVETLYTLMIQLIWIQDDLKHNYAKIRLTWIRISRSSLYHPIFIIHIYLHLLCKWRNRNCLSSANRSTTGVKYLRQRIRNTGTGKNCQLPIDPNFYFQM